MTYMSKRRLDLQPFKPAIFRGPLQSACIFICPNKGWTWQLSNRISKTNSYHCSRTEAWATWSKIVQICILKCIVLLETVFDLWLNPLLKDMRRLHLNRRKNTDHLLENTLKWLFCNILLLHIHACLPLSALKGEKRPWHDWLWTLRWLAKENELLFAFPSKADMLW